MDSNNHGEITTDVAKVLLAEGIVRFIRRKAIALSVLVFVMTGTGVAASGYLATSTSRTKPSMLRERRAPTEAPVAKRSQSGVHPVVAKSRSSVSSSKGSSADATLPRVSASGGTVQALWQLRLVYPDIVGDTVVGLAGEESAARIEAVSSLTGQPRWSVPTPAEPEVLGVSVEGSVVIVEAGRGLDDPAGQIVVKEIAVYSLADGRSLWHTPVAVGPEYLPGNQRAYVAGTIVFAEPGGELIARRAATGGIVWRASRPRSCPQGGGDEAGGDARVAADGSLLVASYPCERGGGSFVLVERRSPGSGKPMWQWRTVSVKAGNPSSFISLAVVSVASAGGVVLLQGQVSKPARYVRTLPNARRWPPALGPEGDEMLLALGARDGRPRWSELGFQNPELALTEGAVCEFDIQGVECRDDLTGLPNRPLLRTGLSELETGGSDDSGDDTAGVAGNLVAVALRRRGQDPLVVELAPVRAPGEAARVLVWFGPNRPEPAHSTPAIVRAGALPGGATLLLLRRLDVPEDPLLALRLQPTGRG
jgi:PQQ-like domain